MALDQQVTLVNTYFEKIDFGFEYVPKLRDLSILGCRLPN
jgi:hypothetical protein